MPKHTNIVIMPSLRIAIMTSILLINYLKKLYQGSGQKERCKLCTKLVVMRIMRRKRTKCFVFRYLLLLAGVIGIIWVAKGHSGVRIIEPTLPKWSGESRKLQFYDLQHYQGSEQGNAA